MIFTIGHQFRFEAAHFLPNVAEDHKCRRLHGHNYRLELRCGGEPDARGFVADFAELDAAWMPIKAAIDHRLLNEVPGLQNPTAENISQWVLERFTVNLPQCRVDSVRVYETDDLWCEAGKSARTREELIAAVRKISKESGSCPGYTVGALIIDDLVKP